MASVPREVSAMHGCDCGEGFLDYHEVTCAVFGLTEDEYNAAADAARRRLDTYINLLNSSVHGQP